MGRASSATATAQPALATAVDGAAAAAVLGDAIAVTDLYDAHVDFVWRNLRRLGVADHGLDDATQDVFLVVHRRRADVPAANVRGWLFGIVRRVAADHRRTRARRGAEPLADAPEPAATEPRPDQRAEQAQAARLVHQILAALPDDKREVFVLAELEQMTAPEIAAAIGVPLNTVYSRLRVARAEFDQHAARLAARGAIR
jgi:RNA polymerase sigma-70 factor (ECF subfamily)